MRTLIVISLIGGILLIHSGATLSWIMSTSNLVSMVASAEEEEESHHTKKGSKTESVLRIYSKLDNEISCLRRGFYPTSISGLYEADRIDLPPELKS